MYSADIGRMFSRPRNKLAPRVSQENAKIVSVAIHAVRDYMLLYPLSVERSGRLFHTSLSLSLSRFHRLLKVCVTLGRFLVVEGGPPLLFSLSRLFSLSLYSVSLHSVYDDVCA